MQLVDSLTEAWIKSSLSGQVQIHVEFFMCLMQINSDKELIGH
jgi:hypothetical protein